MRLQHTGTTALVQEHCSVLCVRRSQEHSHFLFLCTSFSQQQVYKPVPRKVVCCYFSGFRVLKLYFKPTINVFTVLLFHKSLITGNDGLFNGIKCSQTVLSTAAYASGFSMHEVVPVAAHGCSEPAARLLTPSSPRGAGRTEQDLGGCSSLLLLRPCFSQWTWYFSASPNSSSVVWMQHKNTLILGCFLWVSCSGGENQTNYQQFSSSANHSPVKKFYWPQQFKNTAWIQRVKVLLLSPYFLGLAKTMSSFSSKTGGWGGGKTNKYIETGRSEVGSPVPIIYYIFLPVWLLEGNL